MSNRLIMEDRVVLDGATSTGAGETVNVKDFRHATLYLSMASGTATVKVQGSPMRSGVDFDSSQGATNRWDYIQVVDLEDGSAVDGDTGVSTSSSTQERLFEINTNGLSYVTVNVTSHTDGAISAYLSAYSNE